MLEQIREEISYRLELLLKLGYISEEVSLEYYNHENICYSNVDKAGSYFNARFDDNQEFKNILNDVEAKYNVHVFYAIFASEGSSDELAFLTVSNNPEEWAEERRNLRFHKPKAYIYSFTNKQIVEKQIKYIAKDCCLIRRQ